MNQLEQQLDYPFGDTLPEAGKTMEIAPGVLWVRMGLPFALNHINLWLLEDEIETDTGRVHGWTVVDCGISSDTTRDTWEVLLGDVNNHLRRLPIVRVIVTHCHPDHVGLADFLCSRWKVSLWMTAGEYAFARMMSASLPGADGTAMFPHFRKHGLTDPAMLEQIQERKTHYTRLVPTVPAAYRRLQEGTPLTILGRRWDIITGFGHSPEHASLFCAELNLMISGDMLLPRISTNVSVFAIEPEANPVQQYLDSLQKYLPLPAGTLILPSHGKPFKGMHTRITQLQQHHVERLEEVRVACATPQSACDIVPIMFRRPLDSHQLTFAIGEALAHLHKLWFDGVLTRQFGDDGVMRFVVAQ
ncbi:MBL fold metallo-hydrolase [Undibacterium sp. Ji67W]|uniref:MBL fold metallo-hydrolase n=1 Tax=Undibacterium sp. Ji67W TaxID=3413042 RepID=UPI003BEF6D54